MFTGVGFLAPQLAADAFVRGEKRRTISLAEYRGTWVVLALGVAHLDVLELADLEEAFAASGAVVLAATSADWHNVSSHYGDEPVRFPILAGVADSRRITAIVDPPQLPDVQHTEHDPRGVIRHLGLRRSARETLASLEALRFPRALAA